MKKKLSLSILFFLFSFLSYSQTASISEIPHIRKGKITLSDGMTVKFKNLEVFKDTVSVINLNSETSNYPASDIYKITKTSNYAAVGAITTGIAGLLGGVLGTMNWDDYEELEDQKTGFIIGATLGCALLGGIIGACIPKEKVIYKNTAAFSSHTGIKINGGTIYSQMIIIIIPLNYRS